MKLLFVLAILSLSYSFESIIFPEYFKHIVEALKSRDDITEPSKVEIQKLAVQKPEDPVTYRSILKQLAILANELTLAKEIEAADSNFGLHTLEKLLFDNVRKFDYEKIYEAIQYAFTKYTSYSTNRIDDFEEMKICLNQLSYVANLDVSEGIDKLFGTDNVLQMLQLIVERIERKLEKEQNARLMRERMEKQRNEDYANALHAKGQHVLAHALRNRMFNL